MALALRGIRFAACIMLSHVSAILTTISIDCIPPPRLGECIRPSSRATRPHPNNPRIFKPTKNGRNTSRILRMGNLLLAAEFPRPTSARGSHGWGYPASLASTIVFGTISRPLTTLRECFRVRPIRSHQARALDDVDLRRCDNLKVEWHGTCLELRV